VGGSVGAVFSCEVDARDHSGCIVASSETTTESLCTLYRDQNIAKSDQFQVLGLHCHSPVPGRGAVHFAVEPGGLLPQGALADHGHDLDFSRLAIPQLSYFSIHGRNQTNWQYRTDMTSLNPEHFPSRSGKPSHGQAMHELSPVNNNDSARRDRHRPKRPVPIIPDLR
jgi:hypothetical protein